MNRRLLTLPMTALTLAGCHHQATVSQAPPRVVSVPALPERISTLTVPITVSLGTLQAAIEREVPRKLWAIDEKRDKCVAAQRVKLFKAHIKVTPDLGCRIVGQVTRGALRLTGQGRVIHIALPVHANIGAQKVGGVVSKTATADAIVRATAVITLTPQWGATAKVAIDYNWTDPPGIEFLGQRIKFVSKTDQALKSVIADLQRQMQREVAKLPLRQIVEAGWKQGFTVIELNQKDPPAWMRLTPTAAGVLDYGIRGNALVINAAAQARTETFVGKAPAAFPPTSLPAQTRVTGSGLSGYVPVLADYDELEPVILRALRKRAAKGITLSSYGKVNADFKKVTVYATDAEHLAVGIDAEVEPVSDTLPINLGRTKGEVWLTGLPVHAPDSEVIRVKDLQIFGSTDSASANILIALMLGDAVRGEIEGSLTQDFGKDYRHVVEAAQKAIAMKRLGQFEISAKVDSVHHGVIKVTGAGLFLPVEVTGAAKVVYKPVGR
jgi:hypothetical protein